MAYKDSIRTRRQAIVELSGTNDFDCTDTEIVRWGGDDSDKPTEEAIKTKCTALQVEYDAQEYARARQPLYPDIGDQLDDLYHKGAFSAEMTATLKKVRDDNPK